MRALNKYKMPELKNKIVLSKILQKEKKKNNNKETRNTLGREKMLCKNENCNNTLASLQRRSLQSPTDVSTVYRFNHIRILEGWGKGCRGLRV